MFDETIILAWVGLVAYLIAGPAVTLWMLLTKAPTMRELTKQKIALALSSCFTGFGAVYMLPKILPIIS